jgi:beta-galactosidase
MLYKALQFMLLFLLIGTLVSTGSSQGGRLRFTINDGWLFAGADVSDGEKNGIDTGGWQRVDLPHTWNIADTLDDAPGYRRGVSWYRKRLELGSELRGKRTFLYFEGVNQTADVFVNEKPAGSHVGGYTAFVFDITSLVKLGEPNMLAVKVDNSLVNDIPPLDADFNMHGGIYRDVWIIAANDGHFKITDMAGPGLVIRTELGGGSRPSPAEVSERVDVSGVVVNAADTVRKFDILTRILDKDGFQVAATARGLTVPARSEGAFTHNPAYVRRAKLWSPDDPYLYTVSTVLRENGQDLDEIRQPLGFRSYRFDPAEGFFLNGKPLKLRGTNRHQDYKGFGNAVPDDLQVRDLEIIKETGFNFVRLAHYPQDPSVLAAADRLGLMLWEEIPVVNVVHISEAFNRNSETMLREMIRQHRNHPSVILWGYMNEVFLRAPKTDAQVRATVDLARRLEKIAREEDPGRLTAIAFDHGAREIYHTSGLSQITHVVGWNLYFGWYHDTFDDFGRFIDEQHRRFPYRPLFISEYGANADRRVHSL